MINIHDKETLFSFIDKFKEGDTPLFGRLTPQHVLEHLIMSLHLSTGKKQIVFNGNQEVADKVKATLIYTDAQVPQGVKNPLMTDDLPDLKFTTFEIAKQELKNEIEYFYEYKNQNPKATFIHMRMNELTIDEWTTMHGKHFAHHFKQYGLL